MGTSFKVAENVDLVIGALFKLGELFELLRFYHLDGHLLLRLYVDGPIHCRVHASTDLVLQRVVFDHLPHHPLMYSIFNISLQATPSNISLTTSCTS